MAVLKGVKENVHLPLYDSLFVRPRRQLREVESSSIFKFFVNVQGKTKLETNMQSASLLPHWNTFEARALRVVISDLPPQFSADVERCLKIDPENGCGPGYSESGYPVHEPLGSNCGNGAKPTPQMFDRAGDLIEAFNAALADAKEAADKLDHCFDLLRDLCDPHRLGPILQLHRSLRLNRSDLVVMIRRSKSTTLNLEALNKLADELEAMSEAADDARFFKQLDECNACLDDIENEVELASRMRRISFAEVQSLLESVKYLLLNKPPRPKHPTRGEQRVRIPGRLPDWILQCLKEQVRNESRFPLADQVFGDGLELFTRLIFNSVITFFTGEKVMIQMPTWFFPAGGGPYSFNGRAVTHGFPSPEATFRFAEPVLIDTQQNFRVELEIPDAGALSELQRIYGPFFIWVVLDGYMRRDAQ
jgi:hypothetical protein